MVQEVLRTSGKCAGEEGNKDIAALFQSIFSLLAEEVAKPFVSGEDAADNIIENAASHRVKHKFFINQTVSFLTHLT